jgi:hypothetical protein
MARINGTEQPIKKATPLKSSGGFDAMSQYNYIIDDFTDIHAPRCWPMVDTVKEVLADFERIVTKPKLKVVEPNKTTLNKWQRK